MHQGAFGRPAGRTGAATALRRMVCTYHVHLPICIRMSCDRALCSEELGDWMLYDESIRYKAGWVLSIRFMTNTDDHNTGMVHSYLRSMLTHPYARRLLRRVSALSREQ